ncbi:hypothetical protein HPP92_014657 [Vanilla planifolia]|uniref:Uncharacterized protein n=1 Tax=Vanilla planifolia TaxID=51239 RepID=A0A835QLY3_VANPL|nr:hypothetical protein HPP92_014657 [Vanilla planifolia]
MEIPLTSVDPSFAAFCICNLIIALLLLISFGRPAGSTGSRELKAEGSGGATKGGEVEVVLVSCDAAEVHCRIGEDVEGEDGNEDLEKRAEEFIQKMVQRWAAEKGIQISQCLNA